MRAAAVAVVVAADLRAKVEAARLASGQENTADRIGIRCELGSSASGWF